MTVTKEQAIAFVEALTGYTETSEAGDSKGALKSPHAATHLEAILGIGEVATYLHISRAIVKEWKPGVNAADRAKVEKLCNYLDAVATAIRTAMIAAHRAQSPADPCCPANAEDSTKHSMSCQ